MTTENKQYGSLYRKYRPRNFAEILGQDHIVEALKRQVASDNLAHAYLFSGTRGTGKTSTALVFAKAINCLNPNRGEPCLECENCRNPNIDIIEMDAASHNSVDDIREIREFVKFAPARGKKKIYIVDEVHMLSNAAFNALLKTLEEPPEHIVFILATTELHMIPATVQSRCQRFDFKRVSKEGMRKRILDIADGYGVRIEQDAIDLIIRMADGSMRDTLALLEQSLSLNQNVLTEQSVADFFGSARLKDIVDIVAHTLKKEPLHLIETLESLYNIGVDVVDLLAAVMEVLRDLLVNKIARDHLKNHSVGYEQRVREIANSADYDTIGALFERLTDISKFIRYSKNKESILEITLLKFAIDVSQIDTESLDEVDSKQTGHIGATPVQEDHSVMESQNDTVLRESAPAAICDETFIQEETSVRDRIPEPIDLPNTEEQKKPEEPPHIEEQQQEVSPVPEVPTVPEASSVSEATQRMEEPTKRYIVKSRKEVENKSRTREELDHIWDEILKLIPETKLTMLKNSKIGIFVGDEMIVNIKGLSKAREMVVEMQLKADVIHAAKTVTGVDCNVKFEAVDKDKAMMEHDAKKVEDYFRDKGISIQIK